MAQFSGGNGWLKRQVGRSRIHVNQLELAVHAQNAKKPSVYPSSRVKGRSGNAHFTQNEGIDVGEEHRVGDRGGKKTRPKGSPPDVAPSGVAADRSEQLACLTWRRLSLLKNDVPLICAPRLTDTSADTLF